jgi:hypothetical protein
MSAPVAPTARIRALLPSIALNAVAPALVYLLLRPVVGSDVVALAVGTAVPVAVTLAVLAWRRRVDPVGVVAAVGYGIALLVAVLSGGNTVLLELQDAVITGPLGVICLVSVAIGKPLHLLVMRVLARRRPELQVAVTGAGQRHRSAVFTSLVGATLTIHAAVLLVLALTVPTSLFVVLSRPVGLPILALGVCAMVWYRNRVRRAPSTVAARS